MQLFASSVGGNQSEIPIGNCFLPTVAAYEKLRSVLQLLDVNNYVFI